MYGIVFVYERESGLGVEGEWESLYTCHFVSNNLLLHLH